MIEPLFGNVSSMWPGVPSPGLGWSVPVGNRPILAGAVGVGLPQVPAAPLGTAPGSPGLPRAQTVPLTAPLSDGYGIAGGLPAPLPPEIAVGYSVPALLATVAMRRGQPLGPTNDQEIEDFIYDALDLLAGTSEVEVRCEGGRATFSGTVPHKRLKRDVGEIAWGIPGLNDVQNNVSITARRRQRPSVRETEVQAAPGRKQG
jgi:hypothetical protein